ncbi:MAG: metallophosphoesterase [Candidatus Latescibacterota bacterium]|nr:metallophosphoesterase [Candidatus Latescibacterota bacterium]
MSTSTGFRLAHVTDVHVQPELGASKAWGKTLSHMNEGPENYDLVITGGDAVMNATDETEKRVDIQWGLWQLGLENIKPIESLHCIGNHDVLSWKTDDETASPQKQRAITELEIPDRYYSVDRGGWHIILLDSCQPLNGGYTARLDKEQFNWLRSDLADFKHMPVIIVSHVPILSVTGLAYDNERIHKNHWHIPGDWMHVDAYELIKLFSLYTNVRLCLSGHMHLRDSCQYNNVTYICDGALCANWWNGALAQCKEGYGSLELFRDGTFSHTYVNIGWEAHLQ